MALEFDCPYCKATIRVPENTAGKRGRCPQCAARLTVPKSGQVRRAGAEPVVFAPPQETSGTGVPQEEDVIFQEYVPEDGLGIDPDVAASLPPGDIAIPVLGGTVSQAPSYPDPVASLPESTSFLAKSKARRRTSGLAWGMIAFVVLGGAALVVGIVWHRQSNVLAGELDGQVVENPPLPATLIPLATFQLPAEETQRILGHLERNPSTLISGIGLATVELQGSNRGLLVTVQPGAATSLYRVEIADHEELTEFLREHRDEYERLHTKDLAAAANRMLQAIDRNLKSKETSPTNMQEYRDSVGFTAPVQGLGHFVAAVSRKEMYPCVGEDNQALYFLLPRGLKRFRIQGKPTTPFFPGTFEVTVRGTMQLPRTDEAEPASGDGSGAGAPPEDDRPPSDSAGET